MAANSVFFHYQHGQYRFPHSSLRKRWLVAAILHHHKLPGRIDIVYCSDHYLLKLNREHLLHDTFTDIITFDYCEGNHVAGEIYISTDRVRENAASYGVSLRDELDRVLIHGVLHLLGYKDKTAHEKHLMTAQEDYYLSLRSF